MPSRRAIAPIASTLAVQGDDERPDRTDLDGDTGPNVLDQRHSFAGCIVARAHLRASRRGP